MTRPPMRVSSPRTRITGVGAFAPSDAEEREEDGESGIEDDHQENGLHDGLCGMAPDAFGTARDGQSFVAADQGDGDGEEGRLDDPQPEAPQGNRTAELHEEGGKGDVEHGPRHKRTAEHPHDVGVESQQRQCRDEGDNPRQYQHVDRIEPERADRIYLFVHHHGADLGGEGAARTAGDDDRSHQAAEIGAMVVNEEVDAIRTLGLNPVDVLVLPRVVALIATLPLLTFYANIMGMLGGALMSWAVLDISFPAFLVQLRGAISLWSFWLGIIKAPFFAVSIALIGCNEGLSVARSAESVGRHTTQAVVQSIFLVIVFDAAFSVLFSLLRI